MKLGARIIKTGIAVTLSLYLALFFKMEPIIFAGLAAVLSVQPSLYRSWQHILEQIQANVLGAFLAITFTYFLGNEPFIIGLVVVIVIAINLQLKFEKSIPLAIVTVIAIMESPSGEFFSFALNRFSLIFLGIGASILVNAIFLPPRYEDKLYTKIQEINQQIFSYLRSSTANEFEEKTLRQEMKSLEEDLQEINQLYILYTEERLYFKKIKFSKMRKLVLFQQMIQTTTTGLTLLQALTRQQQELLILPEELKQSLQRKLELLTLYNEKVFLKYERKLKVKEHHSLSYELIEERDSLINQFMTQYQQNKVDTKHEEWIELFPLLSKTIDYAIQLQRLDKLIEGYYTSHHSNHDLDRK